MNWHMGLLASFWTFDPGTEEFVAGIQDFEQGSMGL